MIKRETYGQILHSIRKKKVKKSNILEILDGDYVVKKTVVYQWYKIHIKAS